MTMMAGLKLDVGAEILGAIADLPDDAEVEIRGRSTAGKIRQAYGGSAGPERVSTAWCARELGYSSRKWRQWCEGGKVPGAVKDGGGRWRLPVAAAREHFERTLRDAQRKPAGPRLHPPTDPRTPRRRKFHGPRTTTARAGGKR
jgi:hypothetical protein